MTSQLVIFWVFFFVPPTLNLKNNSRKSINKKILALALSLNPFQTKGIFHKATYN